MKKPNIFFCVSNAKRILFVGLSIIFVLACIITPTIILSQSKTYVYTVVIDAGHGGIDGGCVGASGVEESTLNLEYSKTLKKYFSSYGFKVVMTRETENGLYSAFSKNKKKDDMQKRKEIIQKANPNFVISIHMNSYPSQSSRGAQVFYNKDSEASKNLATSIQTEFQKNLVKPRKSALAGDYFIVGCSSAPTVIVECGFVSNPEEEKLLLSEEYRQKLCYSILCGAIMHFS